MSEIYMRKYADGSFRPADQQSLVRAKKLKVGQVYRHEVKKPRNYEFHKKYFSLLNLAFEHQEKYVAFKPFRDAVTMQAGWYNESLSLGGRPLYTPKSISFASMDEIQFGELYDKTINVILKYVLKGCDKEDLIDMVLNYA